VLEAYMPADLTANLEALLAKGADSSTLRFALATRYLASGDAARAVSHAEAAVALDPEYSAAWRLLGGALAAAGRGTDAAEAYRRGIAVAERRGDRQAAKEMHVFLRRLAKSGAAPPAKAREPAKEPPKA
jgi:Flp pilus assembly protein TadD